MKILVTGAAGFFGSNLCEYLLANNHQVVGVDNFNDYYSPAVKEYNIREFKDNKDFTLRRVDILEVEALDKVFEEDGPFDHVIHLAAWAGVTYSIEHPITYVRNNVEGTVNVAELSVKHKVGGVIFASTSSVYGSNETPFTEDMAIKDPKSPYPATKMACELLLKTYSMNFDLPVSIIRIFNPQGKRMRPDLALSKLIRSCEHGTEFPIFQDLDSTGRDYSYVGHMFDAIETIMSKPFAYEVFNLGNSAPVTLRELIDTVEKVTGKKVNGKEMPARKGEMKLTFANIDKAKKMLGYKPSTPIEESIKIFYEWYLEQDEAYQKGQL
ncbi:NAD-dependent epimerase/dehydratase family protein [candidate division WWE3 bacterium]|jgi:UDP-glucuronate 4-epimerase|nr:NAD-dependent epimerase/dehydratase family protein [candidate division WWE3 bacterium]MBT7350410.1 NAD-dependent epimerase/dehydratase family protein [candidate division WWE3 bacterium]